MPTASPAPRLSARVRESGATATSLVGYRSEGRVLIAGHEAMAREAAARLRGPGLTVSLLITDVTAAAAAAPDGDARVIRAPLAAVRGHLGAFQVDVASDAGPRPLAPSILTGNQPYDVVLDLSARPAIAGRGAAAGLLRPRGRRRGGWRRPSPPFPDLTGEFEKPRYFAYDPDICAHGARGQSGCTRCLNACPTDAIRSIGERIEVDPHLCQGGGGLRDGLPHRRHHLRLSDRRRTSPTAALLLSSLPRTRAAARRGGAVSRR